jgi:N-acetylglucosaminyldiphosphoundecaprenol N-acetyl-beta-D-mannosaminyltransferase
MEQWVSGWLYGSSRRVRLIGFINPHVYNQSEQNSVVFDFLKACDLICIDGVGVAMASRVLYGQFLPRVVATRLFDQALTWSKPKINAIVIGGTSEQAQQAARTINAVGAQYGAWRIVASYHGFMEMGDYQTILRSHALIDAVLVGAGTPKSERILLEVKKNCQKAVGWHIGGGTVGLYAGDKKRAPAWLSAAGVEWIHRFIYESHYRPRVYAGAFEFIGRLLKARFSANDV